MNPSESWERSPQPPYRPPAPAPPPGQMPPGQPAWGPPPPYGYNDGYGPAPETEPLAVVALVLSISTYVVCPVVGAVVALVLAQNAGASIARSRGAKAGDGLVVAAKILAWVHLGLAGLFVLFFLPLVLLSTV